MTRPRNPWPRGSANDDGRWWPWWSRDEVQRCHTSLQILLRIRWAARQSCARLRVKVAEIRVAKRMVDYERHMGSWEYDGLVTAQQELARASRVLAKMEGR